MGMADHVSKFVRCPFYLEKQGDKNRIKCEGVLEGTTTQIVFKYDKRYYLKSFCCKYYKKCRIYSMLNKKYDDEFNEQKINY